MPITVLVPRPLAPVLALLAAGAVGALMTGDRAFPAGGIVGVPLAIGAVALAASRSVGLSALAVVAGAAWVVSSGLAGAAGALVGSTIVDWSDPDTRERSRRGLVILAVAALLFGGPAVANKVAGDRADDRAEDLERRLRTAVAATPFEELTPLIDHPDLERRVGRPVTVLPGRSGIAVSAGVSVWWEARCVSVESAGDGRVTSEVASRFC